MPMGGVGEAALATGASFATQKALQALFGGQQLPPGIMNDPTADRAGTQLMMQQLQQLQQLQPPMQPQQQLPPDVMTFLRQLGLM